MMKKKRSGIATPAVGAELAAAANGYHVLQLFITGPTPRCICALANVRMICETYLLGRYELEVVDLVLHPAPAASNHILAVPTLIRKRPLPLRRFIGDLSETERILVGLGLRPASGAEMTAGPG